MVPLNNKGSCGTIPICLLKEFSSTFYISKPSINILPLFILYSLGKSFIKVREIMIKEKDLPFIDGNISIIDAMEKISKKGFGLGLIKIKGIVKGIFTDGDLRRMINNRIDLTSTPIKEVMTKNFKFVKDVDLVLDVSRIMEDQKIYSLIVKNSNKKITGLIRMHEILSAKII